jgi:hypothetical protein
MSNYTELYNIELNSSSSFSAKFIEKTLAELPSECKLPNLTPLPSLIPLDIILPSLTCNFNIEQPIIPPPYYCTPTISGSFGVQVSSGGSSGGASGGAGITRVPGSDCDYSLSGGITIYLPDILTSLPCVPSISLIGSGSGTNSLGDPPSINVVGTVGGTPCDPVISLSVDIGADYCTSLTPGVTDGGISLNFTGDVTGAANLSTSASFDLEDPCAPQLVISFQDPGDIELSLASDYCTDVGLSVATSFITGAFDVTITGDGIGGDGTAQVALNITGGGDSCTPSLTLDFTQCSISLSLSLSSDSSSSSSSSSVTFGSTTLSVCQDGVITSIVVLTPGS